MHLERQIDRLKKMILSLGARVEQAVVDAIRAVEHRDLDLARKVVAGDRDIDLEELNVEEECLHTIALYQPVAQDMRYVVAILKINAELERIGDLASGIAELSEVLTKRAPLDQWPFDLHEMTRLVRSMVTASLDSLVNNDVKLAQDVRQRDEAVDKIHLEMYDRVEQAIRADPELVRTYMHLSGVSRQLERIADHAVNIAEDVIYMAEGKILRHKKPVPHSAQENVA